MGWGEDERGSKPAERCGAQTGVPQLGSNRPVGGGAVGASCCLRTRAQRPGDGGGALPGSGAVPQDLSLLATSGGVCDTAPPPKSKSTSLN